MEVRQELQRNAVADEVSAITAVVRPILKAVLYSLKADIVSEAGGHDRIKLKLLPRLYRAGDGDCGLCFEYAIHEALNRGEGTVTERVVDAMRICGVPGQVTSSILFGAEKTGALRLIETANGILTDESRLLAGTRGQPVKLKRHIEQVAAAFRRQEVRQLLPSTISGLWKADLFVGFTDADRWVGTSVKINASHLAPAQGLRIGIVPTREGNSDAIRHDEQRNLVVCPIPHDQAFMEVFYQGWQVVRLFIDADANVPSEAFLPRAPERQVARYLADRREYTVIEVIGALGPLSQPELLETNPVTAQVIDTRPADPSTSTLEAPVSRLFP